MLDKIEQKYELLEVLGRGGSGTTYSAKVLDPQRQTVVAIKTLPLQGLNDWEPVERFETEAQVLAKLEHPAIPKYLEHFYIDTPQNRTFCIVQEFAEGQSLAERVKQGWRVTEKEVHKIAEQLLEILIYLHGQSPPLIHRDIKPENVIYGEDGKVLLVDFGSVQEAYYSTITGDKKAAGTFGYMAPEQFMGRAEPASDLYGLGATLVFLLTHRSPAELPVDNLRLDFRKCVSSGISERFLDWLEGLLEPDLADRYDSAKRARQALQKKLTKVEISGFKTNYVDEGVRWSTRFLRYIGLFIAWMVAGSIIAALINGPIKRLHTPSNPLLLMNLLKVLPSEICDAHLSVDDKTTYERWRRNIETYLRNGGNPKAQCEGSYGSILHNIVMREEEIGEAKTVVEIFLRHGADSNARYRGGNHYGSRAFLNDAAKLAWKDSTPLHLVLYKWKDSTETYPEEKLEIIQLLLKSGARVNERDKQGKTPLFYHILSGGMSESVIDILLAAGADINAQDNEGYTVLSLVEEEYQIRKDSPNERLNQFDSQVRNNSPEERLNLLENQIKLLKSRGAV